jgi:ABC-type Fe3+/spermidine/putrescine transport system ATPase subunit
VNEPKILLLDEPLSALDQKMREHMQTELRQLQRRLGITFIFVTHDQEEALALSDRIGVMHDGHLEQVSSPRELYEHPSTHFVAHFVGSMGSVRGAAKDQNSLQLPSGKIIRGAGKVHAGVEAEAFVRPEKVHLGQNSVANEVNAKILNLAFKGLHYEVQLEIGPEQRLRAFVPPDQMRDDYKIGQSVTAHFLPADTFIFDCPRAQLN